MTDYALHDDEAEHLGAFRSLTPGQKEVIFHLIREMAGLQQLDFPENVIPFPLLRKAG
jgi:hypothetical protein